MNLSIKKTIIATLAFIVINWKKILEVSIIPLILSLPFIFVIPDFIDFIEQMLTKQTIVDTNLSKNTLFLFLFIYSYVVLSINLLRLVIFGRDYLNINSSLFDFIKIFKYILFSALMGFIVLLTSYIIQFILINFIVYFLIVPLMLNFANIAFGRDIRLSWKLPFVVHFNLFFMQILLPQIVVWGFQLVFVNNLYVYVILQVIILYWTTINLALCYKAINSDNIAN